MDIILGAGGYLLAIGIGMVISPVIKRFITAKLKIGIKAGVSGINKIENKDLREDIINFFLTLSEGMSSEDFQKKAFAYKEIFKQLIKGKYDDIVIDAVYDSVMSELPEVIKQLEKEKEQV